MSRLPRTYDPPVKLTPKQANNYDNLRGSGLFFVQVDEWADCPWAAWEEVLRPMLSTCQYKISQTGEPRKGGHALRIGTRRQDRSCITCMAERGDRQLLAILGKSSKLKRPRRRRIKCKLCKAIF